MSNRFPYRNPAFPQRIPPQVSDIAKLLEPDGLRSDDQLTWLGSCDGVSVLEDSFARARYVSLDAGV